MSYNVILFTDVVNSFSGPVSIPALGAYKLANTLRANGYSCLVVNHISSFTIEEMTYLLNNIVSSETYLIGFSTTFYNKHAYVQMNRGKEKINIMKNFDLFPQGSTFDDVIITHLKSLNNKVKIVIGGSMVRADLNCKYADFFVLGYAEANIVNLVDHVKDGVLLNNSYRNINNNKIIIKNVLADGYDFTKDAMTWLPEDIINHTKLPIEIGRGCVFSCAFCSYPMNGKSKLDFIKEIDIIKQELLHNYNEYGIFDYAIVDDTFNDSPEKLKFLRDMIVTLPFKPQFWCYARLDLICVHPETLDLLYDIGIRHMFFGIETLDRKSGMAIGKGFDREKQISMIAQIKEKYPEIHLHGAFLVGTPYETVESVKQTMDDIISYKIKLDSCIFRPVMIGKTKNGSVFESKFTKDPSKYGYRSTEDESPFMIWENDQMSFKTAVALAKSFSESYRPVNSISGQRDANLENTPSEIFLPEYKRRLFDIIKKSKF